MKIIDIKYVLHIFLAIVFIAPFFSSTVFAQEKPLDTTLDKPEVYFNLANNNVAPNSEFIVDVLVKSPKPINAIGLEISYPVKSLELLQVNNNQSIIDIWRGNPLVSANGIIKIEGGLSKPFFGSGGNVISFRFKAKDIAIASLVFEDVAMYYADGLGTRAQTIHPPANITISFDAPQIALNPKEDLVLPEILNIEIIKDPLTQTTLAVFSVVDKDSGIKAVYLRWRNWFFWSDWELVQNPAPLPKQSWAIQIKAVDVKDNTISQTVYLKENIITKGFYMVLLLIAILCVIQGIKYVIFKNTKVDV